MRIRFPACGPGEANDSIPRMPDSGPTRVRPMPSRLLSIASVLIALNVSGAALAAGGCEVREADMSFFGDQAKTVALGTKMRFNKVLLQEKFDVRVVGGVAILSGNVSSRLAIQTAEKIAREANDIRCVQNHLKIGPPIPEPTTGPY